MSLELCGAFLKFCQFLTCNCNQIEKIYFQKLKFLIEIFIGILRKSYHVYAKKY